MHGGGGLSGRCENNMQTLPPRALRGLAPLEIRARLSRRTPGPLVMLPSNPDMVGRKTRGECLVLNTINWDNRLVIFRAVIIVICVIIFWLI